VDRTSPCSRNVARTFVAVAIATPYWAMISRVDATLVPGASSPEAIRAAISAAILRYGGMTIATSSALVRSTLVH
jgi:hypothetical protein